MMVLVLLVRGFYFRAYAKGITRKESVDLILRYSTPIRHINMIDFQISASSHFMVP
jgi:hypothetical protein